MIKLDSLSLPPHRYQPARPTLTKILFVAFAIFSLPLATARSLFGNHTVAIPTTYVIHTRNFFGSILHPPTQHENIWYDRTLLLLIEKINAFQNDPFNRGLLYDLYAHLSEVVDRLDAISFRRWGDRDFHIDFLNDLREFIEGKTRFDPTPHHRDLLRFRY